MMGEKLRFKQRLVLMLHLQRRESKYVGIAICGYIERKGEALLDKHSFPLFWMHYDDWSIIEILRWRHIMRLDKEWA